MTSDVCQKKSNSPDRARVQDHAHSTELETSVTEMGQSSQVVSLGIQFSQEVLERLTRIDATVNLLREQQAVKDWYTTDELACLVGKAEFTVREWCRKGRIRAEKRNSGRGAFPAWVVSHQELQRYQREGLLPVAKD